MHRKSDNLGLLTAALVGSLCLLYATRSDSATPLTFNLCEPQDIAFRQKAGSDKLEAFCGKVPAKGDETPAPFNIVGCVGPSITRAPPVSVTIIATGKAYTIPAKYSVTCARFVTYALVSK